MIYNSKIQKTNKGLSPYFGKQTNMFFSSKKQTFLWTNTVLLFLIENLFYFEETICKFKKLFPVIGQHGMRSFTIMICDITIHIRSIYRWHGINTYTVLIIKSIDWLRSFTSQKFSFLVRPIV